MGNLGILDEDSNNTFLMKDRILLKKNRQRTKRGEENESTHDNHGEVD